MPRKKQPLPSGLVTQDTHVSLLEKKRYKKDGRSRIFMTNLLYMIDLKDTLNMIIPFYWDKGKKIIDVTAGERLIWRHFPYNTKSVQDDSVPWTVEFSDLEPTVEADYHIEAQKIDTLGKKWDILVNDFPFTDLKNGVESFGVTGRNTNAVQDDKKKRTHRREFYFRGYVPPKELFPQCVEPWNKAADNLIIKIGDSHKDKMLVPNHFWAWYFFDNESNPKSQFHLVDSIGYRGNYARRGGRFPFAQSVLSYYMIFKKDVNAR